MPDSTTAIFIGGPLDGTMREIQGSPNLFRVVVHSPIWSGHPPDEPAFLNWHPEDYHATSIGAENACRVLAFVHQDCRDPLSRLLEWYARKAQLEAKEPHPHS